MIGNIQRQVLTHHGQSNQANVGSSVGHGKRSSRKTF
jgi:hypothetical protein